MEIGKHLVKLSDYGVTQSSGGFPQVFAQFNLGNESIMWHGMMNDKVGEGKKMSAWDVTLTNLKTMGYAGPADAMGAAAVLYDGPMNATLNMGEYEIVVEMNTWEKKKEDGTKETMKTPKVRFINRPGEGGLGKKFDSKEEMMKAFSAAPKSKAPAPAAGDTEFFQ